MPTSERWIGCSGTIAGDVGDVAFRADVALEGDVSLGDDVRLETLLMSRKRRARSSPAIRPFAIWNNQEISKEIGQFCSLRWSFSEITIKGKIVPRLK